jgi:putative thiamine transport system permease protein
MLRLAPLLVSAILGVPILAGIASLILPAWNYFPAAGLNQLNAAPWVALASYPGIGTSLALTLWTGLGATLFSLGIILAFISFCWQSRWWRVTQNLLSPLLAIPHVAFAIGFAFLVAPSGWLLRLVSPALTGWHQPPDWQTVQDPLGFALILAMSLKEVPFLLLMSMAALSQIDVKHQLWLGRSFGYRPHKVWWKLLLPQLYPSIRLPVLAVLAYSLSVVDMALVLGPNRPATLAVQVYHWFNDPDFQMQTIAAAGALTLLLVTLVCIGLIIALEVAWTRFGRSFRVNGYRGGRGLLSGLATRGYMAISLGISSLVLTGLITWSLARRWPFPANLPTRWSLANWIQEAAFFGEPLLTSLVTALLASLIGLGMVLFSLESQAARGRHWPLLAICLPLLLPQLSLIFGVQLLAIRMGAQGQFVLVLWGHLLYVFPYIYLCLTGSYFSLDPRYMHSALSLGRSQTYAWWRVKLALLIKPVMFSWAVGFGVSILQFLPTLMLGQGRYPTVTTEAVAIATGGNRRLAAIYALLQLILAALAYGIALGWPLWLEHRLRRKERC